MSAEQGAERDPVRRWLLEHLGNDVTDWVLDTDKDLRATGSDREQERRCRELDQEDPMRKGYPE